ncbi:MAG: NUDIX hydrolase [Bdellovibrionales bacterium]|nr:NUDIX hydrolase [Bdellovibrionales bacterium]
MDSQEKPSSKPQAPKLTVDVIIDMGAGMVVLVDRKSEPHGWALPGGFVEEGETVEEAALREIKEETGLDVELVRQFHVYSDPKRDPRFHTASVVFVARGWGKPRAGSDAKGADIFYDMNLPAEICFDHRQILKDYYAERY